MKFPIATSQATTLMESYTEITKNDEALEKITEFYSRENAALTETISSIWDDVYEEHEINAESLNWELVIIDGAYFITDISEDSSASPELKGE